MQIQDRFPLRGVFRLRVYKDGKLVDEYQDDNLIVDAAKVALTRLVAGEGTAKRITRIAFGTSGKTPVPSDTIITVPYIKPLDSHRYPSVGQIEFSWSLGASEANGKQISEFGLLCEDNTLFARKVRAEPIAKAADITIDGQWTIIF